MEDDILKNDDEHELDADAPLDELEEKKKKDLIDEDVESVEDLAEEELEEEEPFDDVDLM